MKKRAICVGGPWDQRMTDARSPWSHNNEMMVMVARPPRLYRPGEPLPDVTEPATVHVYEYDEPNNAWRYKGVK